MYPFSILVTLPAAPCGLKEGVRSVLAFFQTLNFHFSILCLKCPPNFFLAEEGCKGARMKRETPSMKVDGVQSEESFAVMVVGCTAAL